MTRLGPDSWEPARAGGPMQEGTLEIWRMRARPFPDAAGGAQLETAERAAAERMHSPLRRAQFVAGHALLNKVRAANGAPLFTSLSHSAQWVIVAATRGGPVGVDVELMRPDRPLDRLARRFFTPEEHGWLALFPEAGQVPPFYALWTAKEALFKALGMPSVSAHFAARRVLAPAFGPVLPEFTVVEGCRVGWFSVAPGYAAAYAAPESTARVRCLDAD